MLDEEKKQKVGCEFNPQKYKFINEYYFIAGILEVIRSDKKEPNVMVAGANFFSKMAAFSPYDAIAIISSE